MLERSEGEEGDILPEVAQGIGGNDLWNLSLTEFDTQSANPGRSHK